MGLIQTLFGKSGPEFPDRIWSTTGQKMDDLAARVRACCQSDHYPLTLFHFTATLPLLLDALARHDVNACVISGFEEIRSGEVARWRAREMTLVLVSKSIPISTGRALYPRPESRLQSPISVHLAEHYPLRNRDDNVLRLNLALPMKIDFTCYTALDEPWLCVFRIETVRRLMTTLRVQEDECLSHPQLTRAIRNAQQQIARQVRGEQPCDSCEEWLQRNYPSL